MNQGTLAARPDTITCEDLPSAPEPVIVDWSVVRDDRILGRVYSRPLTQDGSTITTSPVVHVRVVGPEQRPVAVTASGSAYCLGDPATRYGEQRARQFVWRKYQATPVIEVSDGDDATALLRVVD